MTDIEQALAQALWGQGIEGLAVVIRDDVKEPTPAQLKLAAALASSPSMQTLARQAAIGAAVLHEHKTCTPRECRMYSEYGFSWEGYRPMNIVPCRVAAIAEALEDER